MGNFQTIATLGAFRQEKRLNVIINNLSNSHTFGFKKDVSVFKGMVSKTLDRLKGEETGETVTSYQPGEIQTTGNPLDVAIDGEGFFKISTPNGIRYTRAGNFKLNNEKVLVNANGFPVMGRRGEIILNGKTIAIEKDGSIKIDGNEVDKIVPVTFPDTNHLRKEGNTLVKLAVPEEEETETEVTQSQVLQGSLEASNVNPMEEMIKMLDAQRIFESCLKIIQSNDELNSRAVNDLGRT